MTIKVCSFGYKYNQDAELEELYPGAHIVEIDCRHLPNPHGTMADLNGTNPEVAAFVFKDGKATSLVNKHYLTLLDLNDEDDVVFAFGCIGGKHRSVACSVEFARQAKHVVRDEVALTPKHHGLEVFGLL